MSELTDYLDLIPAQNRSQPNFIAWLSAVANFFVYLNNLYASMIDLFDVDLAVGDQQDILGDWIGISRNVQIPIENVYFSFDGAANVGWDFGVWQPANAPVSVTVLPDEFRRL